jgi:hypothetical protein
MVLRRCSKRRARRMTSSADVWTLTQKAYEVLDKTDNFEFDVLDIADELASLLLKKHKDYGPKNISHSPGGALNGLRVRMHDKIARINHLIDSGSTPENESLEDSYKDLANYSIIALMVLRGKWPQG